MNVTVGLVGVAVGALITLLTGFQSRSWAHNEWLLNERAKVYGVVSEAYRKFTLDHTHQNALEILNAIWGTHLVSSRRVDIAMRAVADFHLPANPDWETFADRCGDVLNAMSADLLYPPRTSLLPSEVRRRLTRARRERTIARRARG